jgi:hypothetical protein
MHAHHGLSSDETYRAHRRKRCSLRAEEEERVEEDWDGHPIERYSTENEDGS